MLSIHYTQCGVDEHAGRQVVYEEEQPSLNMTPKINYEVTGFDHNEYISKLKIIFMPLPIHTHCQKTTLPHTAFLGTFFTPWGMYK